MSDTHDRHDRYRVEPTGESYPILDIPYYRIVDTRTDEPYRERMTKTAAIAAASFLNGRHTQPDEEQQS